MQWILMYWSMKSLLRDSEAVLQEALQMTAC